MYPASLYGRGGQQRESWGRRGEPSSSLEQQHPSLTRTVRSRLSQAFSRFTTDCSSSGGGGGGEKERWEHHTVTLARVCGYGFGVAVSGGREGGEPISISDVLREGPAVGKLTVGDRVVSANGVSLEGVEYVRAVQVLRECGSTATLVVKRRVASDTNSIQVTLARTKKKDDFGVVLGCRIYVKEVSPSGGMVEKELREGDIVLKINNSSTEGMTLKEARKMVENTKEKLQLLISRNDNNSTPQPPPLTNGHANGEVAKGGVFEEKGSSRLQSGRNRGPLMDISLSQLDQPATPLLTGHTHLEEESLQRPPPLPRIDEFSGRFDEDPLARRSKTIPGEGGPRYVSFQKEGSVGVRLTGGSEAGIFVTAVQPGSPASLQGLQPGDRILKVNERDLSGGVTREEAVLLLMHIQDRVHLIVQHDKEEYDEIVANQRGDSFYVRTHFSYEGGSKGGGGGELCFGPGEVFHVTNTMHGGTVGSWLAHRLGRAHQEIQKGAIPNATRAEELWRQEQAGSSSSRKGEGGGRTNFFRRRSARRSKSLSKEHWEDALLADGNSKFPAYERVTLKHPGFVRPVVLFGALADIARDKLIRDYPDKYASPQMEGGGSDDVPKSQKSSGIIRLSAIKEIIEKGKHAVLDVTPGAVERLNYAQFHPVVVCVRAESKQTVKELRGRHGGGKHKSAKKMHEQAAKVEKMWGHIFTATITLTSADMWYKKLRETIDRQQQQPIWIAETKPEGSISDDFLFPMTSRLSYASSPESDLEATSSPHPLPKASSDPSIATQEDSLPPPSYSQLPHYTTRGQHQQRLPYDFLHHQPEGPDPLATSPAKSNGGGVSKEPAPRVDRANKPTHYRTAAQERQLLNARHSSLMLMEAAREQREPPDYINTVGQQQPEQRRTFDSSSYSSDSYNQYSSHHNNKYSGMNEDKYSRGAPPTHDPPYRYPPARQPPPPTTPSSKYTSNRHPDERPPSPPPKPAGYQQRLCPVPPPKPGQYRGGGGEPPPSYTPLQRNSLPYYSPPHTTTPMQQQHSSKQQHGHYGSKPEDFDSGRGSSLDRNYDVRYGGGQGGGGGQWGGPYHNVPYSRRPPPPSYDPPHSSSLIANHENRGSAFELYKKPQPK